MSLAGLLAAVAEDPQLRTALDTQQGAPDDGERDFVAPSALRPLVSAALATGVAGPPGRFVLAVTATAREAEDLTDALRAFLPPHSVATFPGWETLPHERLSPRSDTVGQRIAVLRRLAHPAAGDDPLGGPLKAVVAPIRAVLQPLVAGLGDLVPVRLAVADDADPEDVIARLVEIGYARVEIVSKRGELAVRGGLIDVFPPTEEHPLRIEFFGDTVEEIRVFKVADQRSAGNAEHGLWAPPCRELLLTPTVRARAKELAAKHPGVSEILGKIADGITVEGMEAFSAVLADRMDLLLDHLPIGAVVLACDPERIRTRAIELVATSQEFLEASWASAASGGEAPVDLGGSAFQPIEKIREAAVELGIAWWTLAPFGVTDEGSAGEDGTALGADQSAGQRPGTGSDAPSFGITINALPAAAYRGETSRMLADVRQWLAEGWRVVLVTEGHGPAKRLAEVLRGEGFGARAGDLDAEPEAGVPYVTTGELRQGFSWPAVRLAVLTEADFAARGASRPGSRDERRMPSARRRGGVDPLQLKPGDYVVHEQHGVGRFVS
jgi:transcription-repair coupling factor (superfamily II helicase)